MEYCSDGPERSYTAEDVCNTKDAGNRRLEVVLSSITLTPEVIGKILDNKKADKTIIEILLNNFALSEECLIVIAQKFADGHHKHLFGVSSWYDDEKLYYPSVMDIFANSEYIFLRDVAARCPATEQKTLEKLREDEESWIADKAREKLAERKKKK